MSEMGPFRLDMSTDKLWLHLGNLKLQQHGAIRFQMHDAPFIFQRNEGSKFVPQASCILNILRAECVWNLSINAFGICRLKHPPTFHHLSFTYNTSETAENRV